jgi:hypothetical protein
LKWLELGGLAVALFLIFHADLFALVGGESQFGNPLEPLGPTDRITVLFWSAVVFLYYLYLFRSWAADPPLEFVHTPPRHCTTRSRYIVAQAAYAGLFLAIFWLLIFVPQLIDLVRQAVSLADQAGLVTAAFPDEQLQEAGEVSGRVTAWQDLKPAEAAPYVAMLLLVFARIDWLPERRLREYFQDRALIPKEARDHMEEIGDGRNDRFVPDPSILQNLGTGVLDGLVDTTRYPRHREMHDIIMAEYLFDRLRHETDKVSENARRDSDFAQISEAMIAARNELDRLVRNSRELIRALETDAAQDFQRWKVLTIDAIDSLLGQAGELVAAPWSPAAADETTRSLQIDRVRQDIDRLRTLLANASPYLDGLETLLVISEDENASVEVLREKLRDLVDDRRRLLQSLEAQSGATDPARPDDTARLLDELRQLRAAAARLLPLLDAALEGARSQSVTLDWIDRYRSVTRPASNRVFAHAFDSRQNELIDRYRRLRHELTRLMTTVVLASGPSSEKRARHFARYGFKLAFTEERKRPRHSLWLTFAVVFIISLVTSSLYFSLYDALRAFAAQVVAATPLGPLLEGARAAGWVGELRIRGPDAVARWAFISATMQMMAVWLSLAAWNLSPDYQAGRERASAGDTVLLNAGLTGLVFGFVGSVLAFYLLGLLLGYPGMLRMAWPWTLLGGITGGFLLLQGVNVSRGAAQALWTTAVVQGVVSGLAALLIAVTWGYGRVLAADALLAFALYVGVNMWMVGTVLGLLAHYFMHVDDLRHSPPPAPDEAGLRAPGARTG